MFLVDTNALFDVITDDEIWAEWSVRHLEEVSLNGSLLIVDVVYAELAALYPRMEDLDDMLSGMGIEIVNMTRPALFLAARAFQIYRGRGGTRSGVLPDFFVGAQAAVS